MCTSGQFLTSNLTSAFHRRRVCGRDLRHSVVTTTESFVQPVHKPYLTLCQGHRLCSTYKWDKLSQPSIHWISTKTQQLNQTSTAFGGEKPAELHGQFTSRVSLYLKMFSLLRSKQCLTCLGRERVRNTIINRSWLHTNTHIHIHVHFSQNWVMVAHIWVESKYRILCVTTGNELLAHRDWSCLFWTLSPSILLSLPFSSSDPPTHPYILPIFFSLTPLATKMELHFKVFVTCVLIM